MNNRDIIERKLNVLLRLKVHLQFATQAAIEHGVIGKTAAQLSMADGQVLAAFRMRFSEYQEQLGKMLLSLAREEDIEIKGASSIAAFAEKFAFIESENDWHRIREIRNGINHDYEEEHVAELTIAMRDEVSTLINILAPIVIFCHETYAISPARS